MIWDLPMVNAVRKMHHDHMVSEVAMVAAKDPAQFMMDLENQVRRLLVIEVQKFLGRVIDPGDITVMGTTSMPWRGRKLSAQWSPIAREVELFGGVSDGATESIETWSEQELWTSQLAVNPVIDKGSLISDKSDKDMPTQAVVKMSMPDSIIYRLYGFNDQSRKLVFSCLKKG